MKFGKINIKNYKILKNLKLDFTDKKGKALDIVVLAGLNGTGKTSILEYLKEKLLIENKLSINNKIAIITVEKGIDDGTSFMYFPANYLSVGFFSDSHKNKNDIFLKSIIKYIDKLVFDENKNPQDAYSEIRNIFNNIYKNFDLKFRFSNLDRNRDLFFINEQNVKIKLEELSKGEQELIQRTFTLYLRNIKDGLILIDEPDASLHPIWQKYLLEVYRSFAKRNNNQIILATHSPFVIASAKAEEVFLLQTNKEGNITVSNPKYSKGHSISYILSEIMNTDFRNNEIVEDYLSLVREGKHKSEKGQKLKKELDELLDPNSDEAIMVDFSLRRFKAIGR